jgi:hypothetical protein
VKPFDCVYSKEHADLFNHRFVKILKARPTLAEVEFQKCIVLTPMYNRRLLKTDKKRMFQYPLPTGGSFYILDFFIESLSLGFEINGGVHDTIRGIEKDSRRREQLQEQWRISIVDLDNDYVLKHCSDPQFIKWISAIIGSAYARRQCGSGYRPYSPRSRLFFFKGANNE